jgi:hypothetical protein
MIGSGRGEIAMITKWLFRLAVSGLTFILGLMATDLRHDLKNEFASPTDYQWSSSMPRVACAHDDGAENPARAVDPYEVMVRSRYANFDYAYSVLVPRGMMGAMSPDGYPNHGFVVDLDHPTTVDWTNNNPFPRDYLAIDASYNSAERPSIEADVAASLESLNENHGRCRVLSKTATRLGGLPALHYTASYEDGGEAMIQDEIVAFRTEQGADIVYSITLRTEASRYARDKSLVTEMQRSFLFEPLPEAYPRAPVYEERKQ